MHYQDLHMRDTICALSTATGHSAIAVIRVSGAKALSIVQSIYSGKTADLSTKPIHHGYIQSENDIIDEVVISVFKAPRSYTGQDIIEISCHGSLYIQQQILELLLAKGCRLAEPGEFTMRAFLNNKIDLSQAEAVGDLIQANSKSAHDLAMTQMRGGYSGKIKQLRNKLVEFTGLLELELDFAEEDVEFANRDQLSQLLGIIQSELELMIRSYKMGNVLKNGIPVAIIGKPNVGKSTLLNALLNEEKAIVSEIPGTTRDVIEDTITLQGVSFRFIDTAGLRHKGEDAIENIGIDRSIEQLRQAHVVLYVFDLTTTPVDELMHHLKELEQKVEGDMPQIILVGNKVDHLNESPKHVDDLLNLETIFISAKRKTNINLITDALLNLVKKDADIHSSLIVSNVRHLQAFQQAAAAIDIVQQGLTTSVPSDLLTIDIHVALNALSIITGEVGVEDVLEHIFRNFCIGK